MQVLEKVAKAISRNYEVQVIFGGKDAFTDGKKINIPALPEDLTEDQVQKVRGYCDHEIGHVLSTDMAAFRAAAKISPKMRNLVNILEDFRIEADMAAAYPGAKININATVNALHKEAEAKRLAGGEDMHILAKLWLEGRRAAWGATIDAPNYAEECRVAFGADVFARIKAMASTADAIALAKELIDKYELPKAEPQPKGAPEESAAGGAEGEQDEAAGEDEGAGSGIPAEVDEDDSEAAGEGSEGDDEANDADEGAGGADDEPGDDEPGDDEGAGKGAGGDDADGEPGDDEAADDEGDGEPGDGRSNGNPIEPGKDDLGDFEDAMESLKNDIERIHKDAAAAGKYLVASYDRDRIEPFEPNGFMKSGKLGYDNLANHINGLSTIRGKLANLFLTQVASRWINDRDAGKLNGRKLALVKAGNRHVFREKYQQKDTDTAITLLVDWSGSMNARIAGTKPLKGGIYTNLTRIDSAMMAAVTFLECLTASKVKSEVLSFTTDGDIRGDHAGGVFGRTEGLMIGILKAFDEALTAKVKARVGSYGKAVKRNNADGESLEIAYRRIKARKERRKIIFVITDGIPMCFGNRDAADQHLRDIIKKIEADPGVELVCFSMDHLGAKGYYKNVTVFQGAEVGNMAQAIYDAVKARLV